MRSTSPLRTSRDIDDAIELLFQKKAKSVISVNILNKDALIKVKNSRNISLVKLGKLTSKGHKSFILLMVQYIFFAINFFANQKNYIFRSILMVTLCKNTALLI